jgi:hypothetical protein
VVEQTTEDRRPDRRQQTTRRTETRRSEDTMEVVKKILQYIQVTDAGNMKSTG